MQNIAPRLRRQIILFVLIAVLLSNCLIAFIAITPLGRELHSRQTTWLESQLDNTCLAARQQLETFMDITRQITSRSMIRKQLVLYNQGEVTLEELRAYTAPKLADGMDKVPQIAGMVRFDAGLQPVVFAGRTLSDAHYPEAFPQGGTVWVSEPYQADGRTMVNMGANILDDGRVVGLDLVAFHLDGVIALVQDQAALGTSGAGRLCHVQDSPDGPVLKSLGGQPSEDWCGMLTPVERSLGVHHGKSPLLHEPDGSRVFMHQHLSYGNFMVAVSMDSSELYGPARRILYWVVGLILLASVLSLLGVYYMLRPLARRFLLREEELGAIIGDKTRSLQRELEAREVLVKELERARKQAEVANQAKSEFLASMSHEIRTPLNGILGMLQILETSVKQGRDVEYLRAALDSSWQLNALLSDILDLAKVEARRMEVVRDPFDLAEVLDAVVRLFGPTAGKKGVDLALELQPDLPGLVRGDATKLRQVLNNLVGNAVKFTDQGQVRLSAESEGRDGEGRELIRFTVSDTGIGIPKDRLEGLFDAFTQVRDNGHGRPRGTGLGLHISKQLTELMGGRIQASSTEGKGSTFSLVLPLEPVALARQASSPMPESVSGNGRGARVLVVEDDPASRRAAEGILANLGYRPVVAVNGREGLELLRTQPVDCVLMDIQMPEMDGLDAAKAIRAGKAGKDNASIPIIALTAYAMAGDEEKALRAGMDAYIAKPMETAVLQAQLLRVLQDRDDAAQGATP